MRLNSSPTGSTAGTATVIDGPDQLRQRVAFALSQIMVVSEVGALRQMPYGLASYYDLLVENAFGNFRDLLEEVTLHPAMGVYLSMLGNQKPDTERNISPDENYARELMQLFTIGLVELNVDGTLRTDAQGEEIPTYDQNIIEGFAPRIHRLELCGRRQLQSGTPHQWRPR